MRAAVDPLGPPWLGSGLGPLLVGLGGLVSPSAAHPLSPRRPLLTGLAATLLGAAGVFHSYVVWIAPMSHRRVPLGKEVRDVWGGQGRVTDSVLSCWLDTLKDHVLFFHKNTINVCYSCSCFGCCPRTFATSKAHLIVTQVLDQWFVFRVTQLFFLQKRKTEWNVVSEPTWGWLAVCIVWGCIGWSPWPWQAVKGRAHRVLLLPLGRGSLKLHTKVSFLTLFLCKCIYHGALVVPISIMIASSILVGRPWLDTSSIYKYTY